MDRIIIISTYVELTIAEALTQPCEVGSTIIPIVWMMKLN